jgi:hypothetical protein
VSAAVKAKRSRMSEAIPETARQPADSLLPHNRGWCVTDLVRRYFPRDALHEFRVRAADDLSEGTVRDEAVSRDRHVLRPTEEMAPAVSAEHPLIADVLVRSECPERPRLSHARDVSDAD